MKIFSLVLAVLFLWIPISSLAQTSQKVWTVAEILAERKRPVTKKKINYCKGGRFQPCVCVKDVAKQIQYRPAVEECGNNAAIILSGKYLSVYSTVVRDGENRDRWPAEGTSNCTSAETALGLNKCSVFKVQKELGIESETKLGDAEVHCLGASGYSKLFSRVSRITIKLSDSPDSNADPLVRACLAGPTRPLN